MGRVVESDGLERRRRKHGLRLSTGPEFLESVANDKRVFPWVSATAEPISLAAIWPTCIGIEFETGGFLFQKLGPACYEVHTLFLPKSRGVLDCARVAASFMFCATECEEILTKVPVNNVAARRLTEKMGFAKEFSRRAAFGAQDVDYFRLSLKGWMFQEPRLAEVGREFHARVEQNTNHDEDPAHDQAVGCAIAIAKTGRLAKAQRFYNEWALFAGYEPAIQVNETTFSVGAMRLCFKDGSYELCQ